MWKRYLAGLPLTDRVTFVYDLQSAVLWGVGSGLVLPMASVIARKTGMGPGLMAFMLVTPFIGMFLSVYWGHLADRLPVMPLVRWPWAAARGSLALMALVRGPVGFMLVMTLYNVFASLPGPAYAGIMRANYRNENRGRLMGNIRVASTLVSAAASWAAGVLLQTHEAAFRILFPAAGVLGVVSTFLFARIKVRRQPHLGTGVGEVRRQPRAAQDSPAPARPARFRESLLSIRKDRDFLIFVGLLFLSAFPGKVFIPLEPIWFVDVLHMDYRGAGAVLGTAASVAGVLGYLVWGRLSRKRDPLFLIAAVIVFTSSRLPLVALARSQYQLIPASVASSFGNAGFDLMVLFVVMKLADPSRFSLANGIHAALLGVRGILGPFLGTFLYERGILTIVQIMWVGTAVAYAGVLGMFVFSMRINRRAGPGAAPPAAPPSSDPGAPPC